MTDNVIQFPRVTNSIEDLLREVKRILRVTSITPEMNEILKGVLIAECGSEEERQQYLLSEAEKAASSTPLLRVPGRSSPLPSRRPC